MFIPKPKDPKIRVSERPLQIIADIVNHSRCLQFIIVYNSLQTIKHDK